MICKQITQVTDQPCSFSPFMCALCLIINCCSLAKGPWLSAYVNTSMLASEPITFLFVYAAKKHQAV